METLIQRDRNAEQRVARFVPQPDPERALLLRRSVKLKWIPIQQHFRPTRRRIEGIRCSDPATVNLVAAKG